VALLSARKSVISDIVGYLMCSSMYNTCVWQNVYGCSSVNSTFVLFLQVDVLKSACESYHHTNNTATSNTNITTTTTTTSHSATAATATTSADVDDTVMTAVDATDSSQSSAGDAVSAKRRLVEKILKNTD